jgi:hypothetical protein
MDIRVGEVAVFGPDCNRSASSLKSEADCPSIIAGDHDQGGIAVKVPGRFGVVVLTGALAVSALSGCTSSKTNELVGEWEGTANTDTTLRVSEANGYYTASFGGDINGAKIDQVFTDGQLTNGVVTFDDGLSLEATEMGGNPAVRADNVELKSSAGTLSGLITFSAVD